LLISEGFTGFGYFTARDMCDVGGGHVQNTSGNLYLTPPDEEMKQMNLKVTTSLAYVSNKTFIATGNAA
jgi:hypothetical protein